MQDTWLISLIPPFLSFLLFVLIWFKGVTIAFRVLEHTPGILKKPMVYTKIETFELVICTFNVNTF